MKQQPFFHRGSCYLHHPASSAGCLAAKMAQRTAERSVALKAGLTVVLTGNQLAEYLAATTAALLVEMKAVSLVARWVALTDSTMVGPLAALKVETSARQMADPSVVQWVALMAEWMAGRLVVKWVDCWVQMMVGSLAAARVGKWAVRMECLWADQ